MCEIKKNDIQNRSLNESRLKKIPGPDPIYSSC
jgi:hypothetical protein